MGNVPTAELELEIERRGDRAYALRLRYTPPEGETDIRLTPGGPQDIEIDRDALAEGELSSVDFGRRLSEMVFASPDVRQAFFEAQAAAEAVDASLRIRLLIAPSAPELHALRWEAIGSPETPDRPLLTGENVVFSRYMTSLDWRPVRLRPRAELEALVVVANPSDHEAFRLAAIDVESELSRAREALGREIHVETAPARLPDMIEALRRGVDVLYLICHGSFSQKRRTPLLYLEDQDGRTAPTQGSELVARIKELRERPRLVVLASCQSAGTGHIDDGDPLAAIGPKLAEAGVPAVLAMQGRLTMKTAEAFLPAFFRELLRHGLVDRAMAAARGDVRDRHDWWMPVLFMRLKSGRLWYTAGFGGGRSGLKKWPALIQSIEELRCTPILGPGLAESIFGDRAALARRWAETYGFPLAHHHRESLAMVAQYLAFEQDDLFPRSKLREHIVSEAKRRFDIEIKLKRRGGLEPLIEQLWPKLAADGLEPHRVLASLELPIYLTINPDTLLEQALREAGKSPRSDVCPWSDERVTTTSVFDEDRDYEPSEDEPLVYHLFGRLDRMDSLVLTEDDHFEFLMGVASRRDLIPPAVREALARTSLMFLGFQIYDWDFRLLMRALMTQPGRRSRRTMANVAAQIDPSEDTMIEPKRARAYLEEYFRGGQISIYWGPLASFLGELKERWDR